MRTTLSKSVNNGVKKLGLVAGLACINAISYAQAGGAAAKGTAAISGATQAFQAYLQPVQNLLYAIAAIIALIGGFTIFNKMQNGDQDVKKTILMVVGGCVAFLALATALPAFFK